MINAWSDRFADVGKMIKKAYNDIFYFTFFYQFGKRVMSTGWRNGESTPTTKQEEIMGTKSRIRFHINGVGSDKIRFRYVGLDAYDKYPPNGRATDGYSGYHHFQVFFKDRCLIDFYTNPSLCGYWRWSDYLCNYQQCSGTCQFSMPSSKPRARNYLRDKALSILYEDSDEAIELREEIEKELEKMQSESEVWT